MALVGKAIYSELQSIANGIGKSYNGRYVKEEDALGMSQMLYIWFSMFYCFYYHQPIASSSSCCGYSI